MQSGIYSITNIVNRKKYFGSAVNLQARKAGHFQALKKNLHSNKYLQNAWNTHGETNFKFEVVFLCPENELLLNEQIFLNTNFKKGKKLGYNICQIAGSSLGHIMSAESRKKMSDAKLNMSEETKQKMRQAKLGKKNSLSHKQNISKARKGIKLSTETKQKLSVIKKGKVFSEEHKKNMSLCRLGKPLSIETRQKLSLAHLGKHLSEETKKKISETKLKKRSQND